jgi:hypothetical protein
MVTRSLTIGSEPSRSRVRVVVTVFETHCVGVHMGVRAVTMSILVNDVIMLMLVVGMVVDLLTMRVLMVVWCAVFVLWVHFLSFLSGPWERPDGSAGGPSVMGDVIQVPEGFIEQRGDMGVEQPVDHLASTSVSGDQPKIAQDSQLVRHRRLFHPNFHAELTNRALAGTQTIEYPDPAGRRKSAHESRHRFGGLLGQWSTDHGVVRVSHVHMLTCAYIYVKSRRTPIFFK